MLGNINIYWLDHLRNYCQSKSHQNKVNVILRLYTFGINGYKLKGKNTYTYTKCPYVCGQTFI